MKVVAEVAVDRRTRVELTDREIALIHRGLTLDSPDSSEQPKLYADQYQIFSEFDTLVNDLGIASVTDD